MQDALKHLSMVTLTFNILAVIVATNEIQHSSSYKYSKSASSAYKY